jgi:hypothetical protein
MRVCLAVAVLVGAFAAVGSHRASAVMVAALGDFAGLVEIGGVVCRLEISHRRLDGFNGFVVDLANHDVALSAVSRAPLAKLQAYKSG